ncbi:isocitrate lyase/phosphoenolpyruvate mutase family protein [Burkholderia sp. Ac-20365]|jgi:2-methylisocitrate lyase-like PEP mutase family enzyme|uniref:isocitrate lyase/PEP mutase family protein n=1 Tax=Burkholderia sp. Ac-20365 TaxID=2703897 RepID=UPI00197B1E67|nr:isocitrate lyase/phosphoenolpyruvate mutase family protein [Burkholderia sp. Ac-20365]MBN3765274.1 isocitrate lyase/phosphoenolpyruvate mutase family protein [Burkholderia sp. Ac-20365]
MTTQADKARAFRALHEASGPFIIPNPWDIGSARLLEALGFKALATTSAGYAFTLGVPDNAVGREQMIRHLAELAPSTDLPVSADLENGFGDAPEDAAETIRQAAAAGVVGGSIEDATGRTDDPIYAHELAVERVRAAVEAARALPFPFTLTARAENYLVGRADLADTIRRLQAFQEAGADVLYAPALRTREDIAAVVSSVDRPVNVLMGMAGMSFSVDDLAQMGVKRISVGGALARAALGALLRASNEMLGRGTFTYTNEAAPTKEITDLFASVRKAG